MSDHFMLYIYRYGEINKCCFHIGRFDNFTLQFYHKRNLLKPEFQQNIRPNACAQQPSVGGVLAKQILM